MNDLPADTLGVVINNFFCPTIPWPEKLTHWHSTMLVSHTWLNVFNKCFRDHSETPYNLLNDHFKFAENDSGKNKQQAKRMVRSKQFLTQNGHFIYHIERNETSFKTCKLIAKCCPNLRSFKFYTLCQTQTKMEKIALLFTSLTELTINPPTRKARVGSTNYFNLLPDSKFLPQFQHYYQLKKLSLNVHLASLEHLDPLKSMMQLEDLSLKFNNCPLKLDVSLSNLIKTLPNLNSFAIGITTVIYFSFSESTIININNSKISRLIISTDLLGAWKIHLSHYREDKFRTDEYCTSWFTRGGYVFLSEGSPVSYFIRHA